MTLQAGEIAQLQRENARLRQALGNYDRAARKFIDKCDAGRAHSVETYADLQQCIRWRVDVPNETIIR
jgi:hypothetical protein